MKEFRVRRLDTLHFWYLIVLLLFFFITLHCVETRDGSIQIYHVLYWHWPCKMMTNIRPIPILSIGLSHPELKLTAKIIMKMIFFSLDKLVIDSIELPPTTVDKVISEKKKTPDANTKFLCWHYFQFLFHSSPIWTHENKSSSHFFCRDVKLCLLCTQFKDYCSPYQFFLNALQTFYLFIFLEIDSVSFKVHMLWNLTLLRCYHDDSAPETTLKWRRVLWTCIH